FARDGKDGYYPAGSLVFDSKGNLFGTTPYGGIFQTETNAGGTAFELSPTTNGGWQERIIHNFGSGLNGSPSIYGDSLLVDSSDNLYGTTYNGGTAKKGAVFELSPSTGGHWKETILYSFLGDKASDG